MVEGKESPEPALENLEKSVYDGWHDWRIAIEKKERRGTPRYRWVLERRFGRFSWEDYRSGWWTKSAEKAVRVGNLRLQGKSSESQYERFHRT